MINKLKSGKAAGIDKIIVELLKNLDDDTVITLVNIFNKIFDSGEFPEEWVLGIIVILFKGGERDDLNNYRGITLLSIVSKLLVGVLNERLTKFDESIKLLHENQAGFRKGYRTTDHIFTLFSITNHSLNIRKKPLYVCLWTSKTAFDTVSHHILWCKLIRYGIKGKFSLDLIKSMYTKVNSCVRSDDGLTKLFAYKRGLRQGCLLSPLLFALFLNDLNNFLLDDAEGIMLWDTRLCTILYADDLILVAESSADLQAQMDLLGIYANNLKMEISQKKTKVLVFRKSSARSNRTQKIWSIGDILIDEAKSYKYLMESPSKLMDRSLNMYH